MSEKFYPVRGKVVIKRKVKKGTTETGIVYTPKEHRQYLVGMVSSIGLSEVLPNGKEVKPAYKVGDYVMYDYSKGLEGFGGFDVCRHEQIVAIVEEDTEIS